MSHRFLKGETIINSLRDNGYTNTAYALAELIDNSIQAKADRVELGFIESYKENSLRSTASVDKITVWDNGIGMSPEVLVMAMQFGGSKNREEIEGMGKFGMGLPNSSISQCKRVEVWSWQNGRRPYYTYLDVDEMRIGELEDIPEPFENDIPEEILSSHLANYPKSGTLVVWSKLDRINWKTGKSIFKHCEYLVGRMYRRFIEDSEVLLRAVTYNRTGEQSLTAITDYEFKSNDPLYLMKNTSLPDLPGEYEGQSFFELHDEEIINVNFSTEEGDPDIAQVIVRSSIVKKQIVEEILNNTKGRLGSTIWGKHCAKNIGVSIVRAGRELVLKTDFLSKELREYKGRFIGVEVEFPPKLDHIFGVTNNKQDAVHLIDIDFSELAEQAGFDLESEYEDDLRLNNDNYLIVRQVIKAIKQQLDAIRPKLNTIPVEGRMLVAEGELSPDEIASQNATVRSLNRETKGYTTSGADEPQYEEEIFKQLQDDGHMSESEAKVLAAEIVKKKQKFYIERKSLDSSAFFDVSISKSLTMVLFNTNHIFYSKFMRNLSEDDLSTLELAIAGFARVMNEETNESKKNYLNAIRRKWGEVVTDFISEEIDDEF